MIDDETLNDWRTNYDLHRDPHDLAEFWRAYTPTSAVLALKAAVEEIELLQIKLAECGSQLAEARWVLSRCVYKGSLKAAERKRRDALLKALAGEESE